MQSVLFALEFLLRALLVFFTLLLERLNRGVDILDAEDRRYLFDGCAQRDERRAVGSAERFLHERDDLLLVFGIGLEVIAPADLKTRR